MCSPVYLNNFLRFGDSPEKSILDYEMLADAGIDLGWFERMGLLEKVPSPSEIECPSCDEYAALEYVISTEGTTVYAHCPNCGTYKVSAGRLEFWTPDFTPVLQKLQEAFHCYGEFTEMIPDVLWCLGRCSLSGQSREVFALCGINTWRNKEIMAQIPPGKTSIFVTLGSRPLNGMYGHLEPDRFFQASDLLHVENNSIVSNIQVVKEQFDLLNMLHEPQKRGLGKNALYKCVEARLTEELRNLLLSAYQGMDNAERYNRPYKYECVTQKQFAEMFSVSETMISRIAKNNVTVGRMLDVLKDPGAAFTYGRNIAQSA